MGKAKGTGLTGIPFQKDATEKRDLPLFVFQEQMLHFLDLAKCKEEVEEARNMQPSIRKRIFISVQ